MEGNIIKTKEAKKQYIIESLKNAIRNLDNSDQLYALNGRNYDEFLYHFLSYIHGAYPNGNSLNRKGENNIKKAFQYAVDMDVMGPNSVEGERIRRICKDNSLVEIPQMKCDIVEEIAL